MPKEANPEPVDLPGFGEVRLGRAPPRKDKRNLMFARYVARPALLPRPKARREITPAVLARGGFPLYRNDELGCCTCVTMAHLEIGITEVTGRPERPNEAVVLNAYWATGDQDDGRACLDVLNYWRKTGLAGERILAFAQVNPRSRLHVKVAMELFGGLYLGLALPESAQFQRRWSLRRNEGDPAPWSWGGHAVAAFDYDRGGARIATWGSTVDMTWGFWDRYVDEAYAVISPDWLRDGRSPAGFALERLTDDLSAVTS